MRFDVDTRWKLLDALLLGAVVAFGVLFILFSVTGCSSHVQKLCSPAAKAAIDELCRAGIASARTEEETQELGALCVGFVEYQERRCR